MRLLAVVILITAVACAMFIAQDFGGDVRKDVQARKDFVQYANEHDGVQNGIQFRAAGVLGKTLEFNNVPCGGVSDCDELLDETVHPTDAHDKNYKDLILGLGFRAVCLNGSCAVLPASETFNPPSGSLTWAEPNA